MAHPQVGLFALGTSAHAYIEFDLAPGARSQQLVKAAAGVSIAHDSTTGVNLVMGFRPELWASARPRCAPPDTASFTEPIVGPDGFSMPATQHDLMVWISAAARDRTFDMTASVTERLSDVVVLVGETHGWPYQRHRDLTGFVDGTENPTAAEAPSLVLVPDHVPGAGGTVLLLQKWEHSYSTWTALSDAQQERVIGRTKPDSVELDPRPPASHAARTDQDEYGRIFRRNTAYGTLQHHGTMFVGFSATHRTLDAMLRSMAGVDGERDALTRYATPLTGGYYFVPSFDDLVEAGAGSVETPPVRPGSSPG
jgi:putative iron-dependent peroxidase